MQERNERNRERKRKARLVNADPHDVAFREEGRQHIWIVSEQFRGGKITLDAWHAEASRIVDDISKDYALNRYCKMTGEPARGNEENPWVLRVTQEVAAPNLRALANLKQRLQRRELTSDSQDFIATVRGLPRLST